MVAVTAFDVWMPAVTALGFPVIGVIGALHFLPGSTPALLLPGGLGAWGCQTIRQSDYIVSSSTGPLPLSSCHPPLLAFRIFQHKDQRSRGPCRSTPRALVTSLVGYDDSLFTNFPNIQSANELVCLALL